MQKEHLPGQEISDDSRTDDSSDNAEKDDHYFDSSVNKREYKTKEYYRKYKERKKLLGKVADTADRFNMSSYGVAHIANAVFASEGIIDSNDKDKMMYRKKIDRIRNKNRTEKIEQSKGKVLTGLMFDERIDKTLKEKGVGEMNSEKINRERRTLFLYRQP